MHNRDLEHRLLLAKQHLQEMGLSSSGVAGSDNQQTLAAVEHNSVKEEAAAHLNPIIVDLSKEEVALDDSKPAAKPTAPSFSQQPEVVAKVSGHASQDKNPSSLDHNPNSNVVSAKNSVASAHQLSSSGATENGSSDEYIEALKQVSHYHTDSSLLALFNVKHT